MRILSIETSCDETSAAVVEKKGSSITALTNITATSLPLHAQTGGIIPEQAAREQVKFIMPVIDKALQEAFTEPSQTKHTTDYLKDNIDAIAVTVGPGLIGSLLVGVETAKTLAYTCNKPIIPVNHLLAHIYANFIRNDIEEIPSPFVGLIVSGGHTDLLVFNNAQEFNWIGGTRDDAAGEAFDKIGRLLGLPYPAGPHIEKRASKVENSRFTFSKPLLHSDDYDFSFSGLKTEIHRFVKEHTYLNDQEINEVCWAVQKSITDVLVTKTRRALQEFHARAIVLGGGVTANKALRSAFEQEINQYQLDVPVFFPPMEYCTDNAAMIGSAALINGNPAELLKIKSNPELYFA